MKFLDDIEMPDDRKVLFEYALFNGFGVFAYIKDVTTMNWVTHPVIVKPGELFLNLQQAYRGKPTNLGIGDAVADYSFNYMSLFISTYDKIIPLMNSGNDISRYKPDVFNIDKPMSKFDILANENMRETLDNIVFQTLMMVFLDLARSVSSSISSFAINQRKWNQEKIRKHTLPERYSTHQSHDLLGIIANEIQEVYKSGAKFLKCSCGLYYVPVPGQHKIHCPFCPPPSKADNHIVKGKHAKKVRNALYQEKARYERQVINFELDEDWYYNWLRENGYSEVKIGKVRMRILNEKSLPQKSKE